MIATAEFKVSTDLLESKGGGDAFTKFRFCWLDALSRDTSLSPGAFRLGYVISGYVNRKTRDAWPGIHHLSTVIGQNERTVRRLVDELVSKGYLAKRRGGDGRPNRYRLELSDRTEMSGQTHDRPDKSILSEPVGSEQTGHFCPSDRTFLSEQTGQKCPPNSLKELSEELSEKNTYIDQTAAPALEARSKKKGRGTEDDSGFDRFWTVYPRKVARGQARTAWNRAAKLTDPEAIIAAAERYAAERDGQDATFTKHPATWLRAESWADEPPPPRTATVTEIGTNRRAGSTAKDRTAAAIDAVLANMGGSYGR